MNHLDTAADHLSAAAAALRIAVGESDSALASLSILRALEKTMRAFNEASSLRDALKSDRATSQTCAAR